MRALFILMLIALVMLAACAPRERAPLPTLVPWPTTQAATAISALATATPIDRAALTLPPTFTPTQTREITLTVSPTASDTPSAEATHTPTLRPIMPTSQPTITAFPQLDAARYSTITVDEARALLNQTPLLMLPEWHVAQIYQRGQRRGLYADFVLNVGDCNTENFFYLESLLDAYPPEGDMDFSYLDQSDVQSTLAYFAESFAFKGEAVNSGLNASSVMDPFWADPDHCPPGESPLSCDYRRTHPFASVIMFGANDVRVLNTAGYEMALREIIEQTLERDIIPILSTFTVRSTGDGIYTTGVRFNGVVIQLAREYDLPLINFWLAARDLSDKGILLDNAHLTVNGFNLRNQLTLDMLTRLRRQLEMEIVST